MSRTDLYPSRTGGPTEIIARKDPVIHESPDRADGPLSRAEISTFERKGYLALDDFLGRDETRALRAEAERLRERMAESRAPEVIEERGTGAVRSVFAIHRSSESFRRLAGDPRVVGAARQILGSDVYIHQSRVNYKPGFHGREFFWHSDFETWHVEDGMPRMRAVSLSLSLVENDVLNGPLMFIPGSHQIYVGCPERTPERHYEQSLRRQEFGVPDPEVIEDLVRRGGIEAPCLQPGSALLFDCNIMHGSNGNITPWPRMNVFFVYNSVENGLEAPFSGQPARPGFIASREIAPMKAGT